MDGRKESFSWLGIYRCGNHLYDYIRDFLRFTQMLENVSSVFLCKDFLKRKFSDDPLQSQINNTLEASQRSTTA